MNYTIVYNKKKLFFVDNRKNFKKLCSFSPLTNNHHNVSLKLELFNIDWNFYRSTECYMFFEYYICVRWPDPDYRFRLRSPLFFLKTKLFPERIDLYVSFFYTFSSLSSILQRYPPCTEMAIFAVKRNSKTPLNGKIINKTLNFFFHLTTYVCWYMVRIERKFYVIRRPDPVNRIWLT